MLGLGLIRLWFNSFASKATKGQNSVHVSRDCFMHTKLAITHFENNLYI